MPVNWKQVEREEDMIQRAYDDGEISSADAARELRDLQRDVQAYVEEEAYEAAQNVYRDAGGW